MTCVPRHLLAYRPIIILDWITVLCMFLGILLNLPSLMYNFCLLIIYFLFIKENLSWGSQVNEHLDDDRKQNVWVIVAIGIATICLNVLIVFGFVKWSINLLLFSTALGIIVNGYRDNLLSGSPFSVSGLSANYLATTLVSYGLLFWAIARAVARY